MRKIFMVAVWATLYFTSAFGQNENAKDKIEAMRIGFITQRLALTPEESQQFWPLYNQYNDRLKQIRLDAKSQRPLITLNDEETEKFIMSNFDKDIKQIELKKEYFVKYKKILNVRRVALLQTAERDFVEQVLKKWKENNMKPKQ